MPPSRPSKDRDTNSARVLANRYEVVKKLGSGNFGTAFLCKDLRNNNELKVLKEISVGDLQPDETVDAMHEARLLSKLDHPSIVKFHDSFIDGEFFCIITEYCDGGDLDIKIGDCKKSKTTFDEKSILDWLVQLLLAVQYMHSRRVLHRDLKTRNIFIRNNMVKIGDFGISRILMGTTDMASTFTGTPYYMSPEVLKHEGYNSKSDVWSIGCILFELCALEHAFNGQGLMGVMYKIVEGKPPDLPKKYSRELNTVFQKMLVKNPDERPSASEVVKLPFIANHMTKMKDTLSDEYKMKHFSSQHHADRDAEEIAQLLREKSHLDDLRKSEVKTTPVNTKYMSPRERMRLRKMEEADKKGKMLNKHAKVQLQENNIRRSAIKESLSKTSVPVWAGGDGEGPKVRRALSKSAEHAGTLDSNYSGRALRMHTVPGIPDNPRLAETYYSQFEGDFDDDEDDNADDGIGDDEPEDYDDDDDIMMDEERTLVAEEETHNDVEDFIQCLEGALDKPEEQTITVADDTVSGAFGPHARGVKIKNLRAQCESVLGKETFEKAYSYLRGARYEKEGANKSEKDIMQGLRELVKNPSDCFLVDQLLFLEEQAKYHENS
ncbi:serine/threonine-protein kinase Nek11-like isoform X2 [Haliotis rufescens]|uniref:serine/threonine-protein kinase Nek11-like isoform X2 n=1 Tax=Haliotis rufescens TaxID=6454 RepID=UPI00201ED8C5|nr:serine/threonine-protein kinase Nek11-like isoform X2 [Haliotis rufescens]